MATSENPTAEAQSADQLDDIINDVRGVLDDNGGPEADHLQSAMSELNEARRNLRQASEIRTVDWESVSQETNEIIDAADAVQNLVNEASFCFVNHGHTDFERHAAEAREAARQIAHGAEELDEY